MKRLATGRYKEKWKLWVSGVGGKGGWRRKRAGAGRDASVFLRWRAPGVEGRVLEEV